MDLVNLQYMFNDVFKFPSDTICSSRVVPLIVNDCLTIVLDPKMTLNVWSSMLNDVRKLSFDFHCLSEVVQRPMMVAMMLSDCQKTYLDWSWLCSDIR